jgi:hypothetical protein
VRELRNLVERSLILGSLNVSALYPGMAERAHGQRTGTTDLQTLEKQHILGVLESVQGDKTRPRSCWACRAARWSGAWRMGTGRRSERPGHD